MRALLVLAVLGGLLLVCLAYPQVGLFAWGWLTLMQPHQETWGVLRTARLNFVVALVTILMWVFSKEPKTPPPTATTLFIVIFMIWMAVSQAMSLRPAYSWDYFDRFIRVMIFIFLAMTLLNNKVRIHAMIWILCVSIGYYGVKGGAFTILTGGGYHVWGPPNTMIHDNNHLGGALAFLLPLLNYLRMQSEDRWVRLGLLGSMALVFVCVLGTQSRTAFGALAIGLVPLWWRSRHRAFMLVALIPVALAGLAVMPESWYERMETIQQFDQDSSFMGRVDAWVIATKIALGNPLTGGGFRVAYLQEIANAYLSEYRFARAIHSIYFEILGGMGFVGLGLFLVIIALAFWNTFWIRHHASTRPDYFWARDLAGMAQASLIIYCVAGSTLSIEFWEGPWLLFVILARLRWDMAGQPAENQKPASRFRRHPAPHRSRQPVNVPRAKDGTSGEATR